MNFIPSDSRARHDHVDAQIQATRQLISGDPSFRTALGPVAEEQFNLFANNYIVPDVRHGVMTLSESQRRFGVHAVTAAQVHETLTVGPGFDSFSVQQRQSILADGMADGNTPDEIEEMMDYFEGRIGARYAYEPKTVRLARDGIKVAIVGALSDTLPPQDPKAIVALSLRAREYTVFAMPHPDVDPMTPDLLIHELAHIIELACEPIVQVPLVPHAMGRLSLASELTPYEQQRRILLSRRNSGQVLAPKDLARIEAPEMISEILRTAAPTDDPLRLFAFRFWVRVQELTALEAA